MGKYNTYSSKLSDYGERKWKHSNCDNVNCFQRLCTIWDWVHAFHWCLSRSPLGRQCDWLLVDCAGILEQSTGAKNRERIGLSYRPARLHRLADSLPWNLFLVSLKFNSVRFDWKSDSGMCCRNLVTLRVRGSCTRQSRMTRRRRNWNPTPSWPEVRQSERCTMQAANHTVQKNSQSLCIIN